MTPNDIEFLIHCHCAAGEHPRFDRMKSCGVVLMFIEAGLIEKIDVEGNKYMTTDGGKMLMDKLCNTPFPKQQWAFSGDSTQ